LLLLLLLLVDVTALCLISNLYVVKNVKLCLRAILPVNFVMGLKAEIFLSQH